jgi:alkaline phosphatase
MSRLGQSTVPSLHLTHIKVGPKLHEITNYMDMDVLVEMDKAFRSLVNMIEESGLAENTIIIFTSDNDGIKTDGSTEHGHNIHDSCHGAKGDVYEVGHRERVMSTRVAIEFQLSFATMVTLNFPAAG